MTSVFEKNAIFSPKTGEKLAIMTLTPRTEWILALRAVTQKPLDFFLENAEEFRRHRPDYGTEPDLPNNFVYESWQYKTIFHQVPTRPGLPDGIFSIPKPQFG
jgi:hypothetical protein